MKRGICLLLLSVACYACGGPAPIMCDPPYNPTLTVVLQDAATMAVLDSSASEVSAALPGQDFAPLQRRVDRIPTGVRVDTLHYWHAYGEGRYAVRVRRQGYLAWDTVDVRVGEQERGPCKQAAHVVARLHRSP